MTNVSQSDAVVIVWGVNEISSTSFSWQSYITSVNITAVGVGTHNSSLTIPGDPTLNGTAVECVAAGEVNSESYWMTSTEKLYMQGQCYSYTLYTYVAACRVQ